MNDAHLNKKSQDIGKQCIPNPAHAGTHLGSGVNGVIPLVRMGPAGDLAGDLVVGRMYKGNCANDIMYRNCRLLNGQFPERTPGTLQGVHRPFALQVSCCALCST